MKGKTQLYYDSQKGAKSRAKKAAYDKAYNKKTVPDRVARNKARRNAIEAGRATKGDGKDLHHPSGLKSSKTVLMSKSRNRGMKGEGNRKKGPR